MELQKYFRMKVFLQSTALFSMLIVSLVTDAAQEMYFIHSDHLNTPQVLTDSNQEIVWRVEQQSPFGEAEINRDPDGDATEVVFNLRFPGQYYDEETGTNYNYYRTYDPSLGRYIQSDPIGLNGGIKTYAYVGGNPINRGDPTGLVCGTGACVATVIFVGRAAYTGYRAYRTSRAVRAMAQASAMAASYPGDPADRADEDANEEEGSCPLEDTCLELSADIDSAISELKDRWNKLNSDPLSLSLLAYNENPGGDLDGCGTFIGHHIQYESKQDRLKKLMDRATRRGCSFNPEAQEWANKWAPPWPGCWDN